MLLLSRTAEAQVFVSSPDSGSDFLAEFSTSLTNQGSGITVPGVTDSAGVTTILGSDLFVGNGSSAVEYGLSGGTSVQTISPGGSVTALPSMTCLTNSTRLCWR